MNLLAWLLKNYLNNFQNKMIDMVEIRLIKNGKVLKCVKSSQYRLKSALSNMRALARIMPRTNKDSFEIVVG